jgi:hypothetical protein
VLQQWLIQQYRYSPKRFEALHWVKSGCDARRDAGTKSRTNVRETSPHYRQVLHCVQISTRKRLPNLQRIAAPILAYSMLVHLCRAALRMPMEKRMPQHRPTWVPAIFALLSIATSCAASARAVHGAPCIAKPNAPPPQGEHWYYRTDRATKRQCWYLGPEDANIQGATRASYQPAADVLVQPVAPQRAQQSTALALTAAPATTEANVPAPAAPPPWPEAAKLPDAPPTFAPPPTPALAERQQSVDAIDSALTPASDPAKESQSPAIARSSPASAPAESTDDADHTLALAMIVFAAIAISGSVLEVTRGLRRRKARNRREFEWAISNTLYQRARASLDFDSRTPVRHIPPTKPLGQAERLAQDLQQILNELQTRPYVSQSAPSDLPRSSRPPVAAESALPEPTR